MEIPKILKNYLNEREAPFDFYDVSFKLNYANPSIDINGRFIIHSFLSRDEVRNNDPFLADYFTENKIGGMEYFKAWSSPLFSIFSISYSGFNAEIFPNRSSTKPRANSVDDISGNLFFTYVYDNRDELTLGVQTKYLNTKLNIENIYYL